MAARVHGACEERPAEFPRYLVTCMDIFDFIGAGSNSPSWRVSIFVLVFSALNILPFVAIGEALGNYRYGLSFCAFSVAMIANIVVMVRVIRNLPESTPWNVSEREYSGKVLKETFTANAIFCSIWSGVGIAMIVSFVLDELTRRNIDAPGASFYVICVLSIFSWFFTGLYACFSIDFVGHVVAHRQQVFYDKIKASEYRTCDEAMRAHQAFHAINRRAIDLAGDDINYLSGIFVLASIMYLYDYMVMPHSHWMHLVLYIMSAVSITFKLPESWAIINERQTALISLVAESVGENGRNSVDAGSLSKFNTETLDEDSSNELWDSLQRTKFIIYLNSVEAKVHCFGWVLGREYIGELLLFYGSMTFVAWQVTALSQFSGFSFDKNLE